MSQQFINDCFAFARDSRVLEGCFRVDALERLEGVLAVDAAGVTGDSAQEEVRYRLQGSQVGRGPALLHLTVVGKLALACQRCLGPIDFPLEVDTLLQPVRANAPMSQDELEDDSRDFLPVDGPLDVMALVEDEIILALPVAARHENCGLPGEKEAGERITPFSTLAEFSGKPN